ncbi:hypothetical protein FRC01_000170 [Tulasnella sp. 417]|nr:hypothetical protein FRC01_000170 [Tulasnella sp. 417]
MARIAIPFIWRDVPDIRDIFRLLSYDPGNRDNARSALETQLDQPSRPLLSREIQDMNWNRFLFHSNNTKSTTYDTEDLQEIVSPEIWSHPLFPTSFPNLERLFVSTTEYIDEEGIDIILSLLRPSLRSMEYWALDPPHNFALLSTLRAITETKKFSLEEMSFDFLRDAGTAFRTISRAISSQTSIRRLKLDGWSDIARLAGSARDLPFLEELEVQGVFANALEVKHDDLGFRSLATFAALGSPEMIHSLLRSIGSNRLSRIALLARSRGVGERHQQMIAELQRFRLHLANLRLEVGGRLSWEVFEPALNLAELQTFDLEYAQTDPNVFTDEQLRQMIDAWPNLTQLRLQLSSKHITLKSLAYIATHCPKLQKLAITFDARATSNPPASRDVANFVPSKNALELFDVIRSEFDEAPAPHKMHPCWELLELVSEVISLLPPADQARLARVNTALWEITIPHIWRDVTSINSFIDLFPPDLWSNPQELTAIAQNRAVLVEEIHSCSDSNISALSDGGARAIASQTGLRRLVIQGLPEIGDLAERAEDFPLLEELDVGMAMIGARPPERHSNKMGFRSLTTLTMDGSSAENHHLISSIGSNRLTRVALRFVSFVEGPLYPEVIAELRRFRPHLAHLQLVVLVPFSWTGLEPALDLAELQSVALSHYSIASGGEITDDRLRQMVEAWPRLTRLYVRPLLFHPHITLTSLAYIATHLPNLKKLGVVFDARKTSNPLLSQDVCNSTFTENALEVFDVFGSRYDDEEEKRVAKDLFRCWWPRACLCESGGGSDPDTDWDIPFDKGYSGDWQTLNEDSARHALASS